MPKTSRAVITTGTFKEFEKRVMDDAKALDGGEMLKPEIRITFEDPADLLRALSSERVRLLRVVRMGTGKSGKFTLSALAFRLKRNRASVNRDVVMLENLGLVRTHSEANPGHGRVKIVEPLAEKYYLTATL